MNEILDSDKELSYKYTTKSYQNFKYSFFILLFFFTALFTIAITGIQLDLLTLFIGLPLFVAVPISVVGFVRGIQSVLYKEPNSTKMMIGLIGNLVIVAIFFRLIVANVMDIIRTMS
jgi:hypothetical protein